MDNALAARRLAGAIGRKVTADDIEFQQNNLVQLKSGEVFVLSGSNTAYAARDKWWKNGEEWDPDAA